MATRIERLQALYDQTLTKLEEAQATDGINVTVGGLSVNRKEYIDGLLARLESYEKKPGVVPEVNPSFQIDEFL